MKSLLAIALVVLAVPAAAQQPVGKLHRLPATPATVAYGYYWAGAKPVLTVGSGDIVRVCPGTYPENVVIDKEISAIATNGPSATTVNGTGIAFDVRRSGVTISGFTIEAAVAGVSASAICARNHFSWVARGA